MILTRITEHQKRCVPTKRQFKQKCYFKQKLTLEKVKTNTDFDSEPSLTRKKNNLYLTWKERNMCHKFPSFWCFFLKSSFFPLLLTNSRSFPSFSLSSSHTHTRTYTPALSFSYPPTRHLFTKTPKTDKLSNIFVTFFMKKDL